MWQKVLKQLKSYNIEPLYWSIFKAANYGNLEEENKYITNEEPLGEQYASRFVGMT